MYLQGMYNKYRDRQNVHAVVCVKYAWLFSNEVPIDPSLGDSTD